MHHAELMVASKGSPLLDKPPVCCFLTLLADLPRLGGQLLQGAAKSPYTEPSLAWTVACTVSAPGPHTLPFTPQLPEPPFLCVGRKHLLPM